MGFKWKKGYFYDCCLAMGCSSSCRSFETFSTTLVWILQNVYKVKHVVKVLDDFLFIVCTKNLCQAYLDSFLHLCSKLGVPVSQEKTTTPSQIITFLGIQLDSFHLMTSLPEDKIVKYSNKIKYNLQQDTITLTDLRSLIGSLHFDTSVVTYGHPFLWHLIDLTRGKQNPTQKPHLKPKPSWICIPGYSFYIVTMVKT